MEVLDPKVVLGVAAETRSRSNYWPALLSGLSIPVLALISLYQLVPPRPADATAPFAEFSAARAAEHLAMIAQKPHPVGSTEHAAVGEYLIKAISELGLTAKTQTTSVVSPNGGYPAAAATVKNIYVRLPGKDANKAILFAAHYDSVPTGPGAADNAAGVATLLEIMRALRGEPPLRRDLIFLFTDAEEVGLLGAEAFAADQQLTADVGLVLNFEARGVEGSSIMFETSDNNGMLIKEFAKAVQHPVASSLSYEIYKRLPNDTDLTIFKDHGFPGLNFAFIEGLESYHTQLDSIDAVSKASIQHHGEYGLALAHHFGNLDFDRLSATGDAVYFSVFSFLVHYPAQWAVLLVALATVLFAAVAVFGIRKRCLTIRGMAFGAVGFSLSVIVAAAVAAGVWSVASAFNRGPGLLPQGGSYSSALYLFGFAVLGIGSATSLLSLLRAKISTLNASMGAIACWLVPAFYTGVWMRGASYLFAWPILFNLAAIAFALASKTAWRDLLRHSLVSALCSIPSILLLIPMIYLAGVSLGLQIVPGFAAAVAMIAGLLIPQLELIAGPKKWFTPVACGVSGLLLVSAAVLTARFDANHRRPNSIFYAENADSKKAIWASLDSQPDQWTSQFFKNKPTRGGAVEYIPSSYNRFVTSNAAAIGLDGPEIKLISDETAGALRVLRLKVTSPRKAPVMMLRLDPDASVIKSTVNGWPVRNRNGQPWALRYYGVAPEGLDLRFEVSSSGPVKITATDQSYGLPEHPSLSFTPRPDQMMPASLPYSDTTMATRRFAF